MSDDNNPVKIEFLFSKESFDRLNYISKRENLSFPRVIREALKIYNWFLTLSTIEDCTIAAIYGNHLKIQHLSADSTLEIRKEEQKKCIQIIEQLPATLYEEEIKNLPPNEIADKVLLIAAEVMKEQILGTKIV